MLSILRYIDKKYILQIKHSFMYFLLRCIIGNDIKIKKNKKINKNYARNYDKFSLDRVSTFIFKTEQYCCRKKQNK